MTPPPAGAAVAEAPSVYRRRAGLGLSGEEAAARHLASLGFRILARRFRTRGGEIDLVADDAGTLVFVEVKSRASLGCGRPAESVHGRKRARLVRAAQVFLARQGLADHPCRFDVAEVFAGTDGRLRVALIRDAFQA